MAWFPCNIGGGSSEPSDIGCPKIFDDVDRIDGKYIDLNDGTEKTDDPNSVCTGFIDISSYDFFIVDYNCSWQSHYYNVFYDTSKQYIQNFSLTPNTLNLVDDIPSNAKYVRISWSIATETNVYGGNLGIKNPIFKQGTFVSASSQFGIVDIDCGFKPDLVMVRLPFGNNDTTSYWEKGMSWAETHAMWNLYPAESVLYYVELDRQSGETGIQAINDNGFSFMSNGGNTQGVTCEYIAVKYEAEQPQTDDRTYLFKDGEWKNQDILSLYGYKTSVENGSLKCTGTHAGVVVDDVSGLDSSVTQYSVYLKVRAGNVPNYPLQTGRNVPTQNLYDIIHYGTDRYSYNTDVISSGTDYLFILNALSNTDGVFLGTENYTDDTAYYYIDEIWLEETPTQVIVHS